MTNQDPPSHDRSMTTQVNIYEAKAQLSKLIDRAEHGEDIVIARAGRPAVRLVKWEEPLVRTPGMWAGQVQIADDFDRFTASDERDWYAS